MRRSVFVRLAFVLASACASRLRVEVSPAEVPIPPRSRSVEATATAGSGEDDAPVVLTRSLVQRTVQAGIGSFLSGIELSPVLRAGRFVGFRIERARALPRWNAAGLALRPGDVVTRVNGSAIERPEQAQAVFARMVDAEAIVLDVLRDDSPVTLRVPITADPSTLTDASPSR